MSEPLHIEQLAAAHVRTAETRWGTQPTKAPGAIRAELEHGSSLIERHLSLVRAMNIALPGLRRLHLARIHYDLSYRLVEAPWRLEIPGLSACQPWKPAADRKSRTPDDSELDSHWPA